MPKVIQERKPVDPEEAQEEMLDSLVLIVEHLKSIRTMLSFFVALTIIAFALGACSILFGA